MAAEVYTFNISTPATATDSSGFAVNGWGYSIANQSDSLWLVLTNLNADPVQYADPATLFDFPILAPGQSAMQPYDQLTQAGLYQITWHTDAPSGFVNSGSFAVMAEWWNGDPLVGGSFVSSAPSLSQSYSASPTGVPEPGTGVLIVFALTGVFFGNSARRRLIKNARH
jgi:hypothetical protein